MQTNIVIDADLLEEAKRLTGLQTKKAVVEEGLKLLVRLKRQEEVRQWRGKLQWEGDLNEMRTDRQ